MTLPFLVKDSSKNIIACQLHLNGQPDLEACNQILMSLKAIFEDQLRGLIEYEESIKKEDLN